MPITTTRESEAVAPQGETSVPVENVAQPVSRVLVYFESGLSANTGLVDHHERRLILRPDVSAHTFNVLFTWDYGPDIRTEVRVATTEDGLRTVTWDKAILTPVSRAIGNTGTFTQGFNKQTGERALGVLQLHPIGNLPSYQRQPLSIVYTK
ncbi:MAG: hypothetical protein A2632_00260 [Candidatus Pacebacteria bacterium RIFCSPHIGHO2_01_FULL_46_16]|nr:MAG: hypothetical protein A2632_00260 [Candidatus Pacebacteria bacterium RIFCSPHIGHO2_01_FULL_46_16]OGJ21247.1 MAG: hypothetical protein A3J60_00490 [Candidatus Pacebacteria bacterium RIFCSPHIGHO2_02_FULL_46_9]OGJ38763.1 MAG: hypothetical protein A3A82_03515 [Candidatus Pacebacteria bacterium RIFCSPLOWO2_01_FULL_47_12]